MGDTLRLMLLLGTVGLLGGCASKETNPDADLQELVQLFPGHYDNLAQVQADLARGVQPPHDALALDIVPVDSPMIGENAFYVQETVAGDPRRVTGQKIVVFGVVKKQVVQTDFTLLDPLRWRNGQRNPDLFKSLITPDVRSAKGCSLRWKHKEAHFEGSNDPKTCHGRVAGTGMAQIEARAELSPEGYSTAELAYDKPGHLARGRQDDPFYRFRKQSRETGDEGGTSNLQ